jgi:limonene-1,2-epoxide hydrolase
MATTDELDEEQALQRFHIRQRRALNNALGSLLGRQTAQTFLSFGFEDAVDLQIEAIEGASTALRPNQLERVDRVELELTKAVNELKELPPEKFLEPNPDEDVNTEASPE